MFLTLENATKCHAGVVELRFTGDRRNSKLASNFCMAHAMNVVQDEHTTTPLWKCSDRLFQCQKRKSGVPMTGRPQDSLCGYITLRGRYQRNDPRVLAADAKEHHGCIYRNPVEPCTESRIPAETMELSIH